MKREKCSACDSTGLEEFLDLGMSPIADAYTTTIDEVSPTYPLQVAVCPKCHLVQLLEVVDRETLFGTGYSFYSSASAPLVAYHHHYADDVIKKWSHLVSRGVVEIGCNDGDFLRHFARFNFPHLGIDPADGPVSVARTRNLNVITDSFGMTLADQLLRLHLDSHGVGIVIANHVLAHVESIADVLGGIKMILASDGIAMIEVQYLPDLLVNNAFDLVYHEHRNFLSLSSLEQAAQRWDLYVIDAELTNRQGGSLRVTLANTPRVNPGVDHIRASERWLHSFGAYEGMQGRAERIRDRLLTLIESEQRTGRTVFGYGAPAKATTLFSFCGINATHIEYVIDTTEAKQGRFIPGSGIPIVAPRFPAFMPSTYLVTAWNYLPQIMRREVMFSIEAGHWLVPFPAPIIL